MNHRTQFESQVQRWIKAGLIDAEVGSRIIDFETGQERRASLRWPVLLALAFGGILCAAGVTLFVAAHWADLSPAIRFSLVLFMVAVFHIGGAALAERFPPLATTLHALGTATLGAAIFLTAQIFNLRENWATGILLWAVGATAGYILLRDWIQAGMLSLLVPAWLVGQWSITTQWHSGSLRPVAVGLVLTALSYLSARIGDQESAARQTLVWIGGLALFPCLVFLITAGYGEGNIANDPPPLGLFTLTIGWIVALAGPLIFAWLLRGRAVWVNSLWAIWAFGVILCASYTHSFEGYTYHEYLGPKLGLYAMLVLGSIGLVAWGLNEKRKERVNLGVAGFAISVLFFYFDSFMGKLGRSASLLLLGVLCLAGGYALEVTRRNLMARMENNQ